ncbi:putative vinorine synthase [Helianthus debilis subsp. tardiflorus]
MKVSSGGHSLVSVDQEAMVVTKRFRFNGTSMSKLRAKSGSANGQHTRVTLVASLIWKALITVDQVKCGSLRNRLLAPAMSLRGKASSPVLERSFGNVWAPYPIRFLQNETGLEFGDLVDLIEDTTRNVIIGKLCLAHEELEHNKFCIFTSWCRFPMYEADFGWGKPYWVNTAGSSVEMVTLMDDKDGDGIEAWVSLNQKEMYVFGSDQDILDLTS